MNELDKLLEKLRQHLFGSGELTKDDLWRLYDTVDLNEFECQMQAEYERGYDAGRDDGYETGWEDAVND